MSSLRSYKMELRRSSNPNSPHTREIIDRIRATVRPGRFSKIVDWAWADSILPARSLHTRPKKQFSELTPDNILPAVSLAREIHWAAALLKPHSSRISEFRRLVAGLSDEIGNNRFAEAVSTLDRIEDSQGKSLWIIEAKLCVLQLGNGLESQKQYASSINTNASGSFAAFAAYYISERNEDTYSAEGYVNHINQLIQSWSLPPSLKQYILFRFLHYVPTNDEGLAGLLRVESEMSIIDLYETFLEVVNVSLTASDSLPLRTTILKVLDDIAEIHDYRIEKLRIQAGDYRRNPDISIRADNALDMLLDNKVADSRRASREILAQHSLDPMSILVAALTSGQKTTDESNSDRTVSHTLTQTIGHLLTKDEQYQSALSEIKKWSLNLRFLNISYILNAVTALETQHGLMPLSVFTGSWIFAMPTLHPFDTFVLKQDQCQVFLSTYFPYYNHNSAADIVTAICKRSIHDQPDLTDTLNSASKMIVAFCRDDYETCMEHSLDLCQSESNGLRLEALRERMWCMRNVGPVGVAIDDMVKAAMDEQSVQTAFPFSEFFANTKFLDFEEYKDKLSLSIAIDLAKEQRDNDDIRDILRAAWDEFLDSKRIIYPSELINSAGEFDQDELFYFLEFNCKVEVMDISVDIRGTRALLVERLNVCKTCAKLRPERSKEFEDQIVLLSKVIKVNDGLKLFDRSRVHIDIDRLYDWAAKNLRESFNRYQTLLLALPDSNDDELSDTILRSNANRLAVADDYRLLPSNESDAVLLDIIVQLHDTFLNHKQYGLNYYLSTRVRHGSLPSKLRYPVENESLITIYDSKTKQHKRNSYWLDRFVQGGAYAVGRVEAALDEFGRDYDSMIQHINQDLMFVRGKDTPDGLFWLEISVDVVKILRTLARQLPDFGDFIVRTLYMFMELLAPALAGVRNYLQVDAKSHIEQLFEKLLSQIQSVSWCEPYTDLHDAITAARTSVQTAIDSATDWFQDNVANDLGAAFKIEEVLDVSLSIATSTHSGPELKINKQIDVSRYVNFATFSSLVDIFLILLDNVYKYSGLQNSIPISIGIVTSNSGVLSLSFESALAIDFDSSHCIARLTEIEEIIETNRIDSTVTTEQGSGLLKVHRTISRFGVGSLSFKVTERQTFLVAIDMRPVFVEATLRSPEEVAALNQEQDLDW